MLQNVIWTSLSKGVEPLLSSWPVNKLRERALSNLMEHIHYEDENTNYICVDAVSKVMWLPWKLRLHYVIILTKCNKGGFALLFCALVLVLVFLLVYDIIVFSVVYIMFLTN